MPSRRSLLLAFAGLLASCDKFQPRFHATELGNTSIGSDFDGKLVDFHGRPRNLSEFHGKVIILVFGYTSCPDICPTALAKYAALLQEGDLDAARIQLIFVSLDPARDTPERLGEYVSWFSPSFLGLTGSQDAIDAITKKFRVTSVRKDIPSTLGYVLDHSAGAYVFGTNGQLRLYLSENAKPQDISDDLRTLLTEK